MTDYRVIEELRDLNSNLTSEQELRIKMRVAYLKSIIDTAPDILNMTDEEKRAIYEIKHLTGEDYKK